MSPVNPRGRATSHSHSPVMAPGLCWAISQPAASCHCLYLVDRTRRFPTVGNALLDVGGGDESEMITIGVLSCPGRPVCPTCPIRPVVPGLSHGTAPRFVPAGQDSLSP